MALSERRERRVPLSLRVPAAHAEAVVKHAETLSEMTRVLVSPSSAGAAILEAGLVALGLIEASERSPAVAPKVSERKASAAPKRAAAPAAKAKKGGKEPARKP